LFNIV